jgi:hypothetical protein
MLIGTIPEAGLNRKRRLEIRTQYTTGGTLLKELRKIRSKFPVRQAPRGPQGLSLGAAPKGLSLVEMPVSR